MQKGVDIDNVKRFQIILEQILILNSLKIFKWLKQNNISDQEMLRHLIVILYYCKSKDNGNEKLNLNDK